MWSYVTITLTTTPLQYEKFDDPHGGTHCIKPICWILLDFTCAVSEKVFQDAGWEEIVPIYMCVSTD